MLICSGNHSRYRLYKPKEFYRRLKMAYHNYNNMPIRVWPEVDLLFRKLRKNYINGIIPAERRGNDVSANNEKVKQRQIYSLKNYLKTVLSTVKHTRVYVRTNSKLLKKAGYFNVNSLLYGFEIFLKKNQVELLSRKSESLKNRIKKLKFKHLKTYLYFKAHKEVTSKTKKIIKIK